MLPVIYLYHPYIVTDLDHCLILHPQALVLGLGSSEPCTKLIFPKRGFPRKTNFKGLWGTLVALQYLFYYL